jgi:hypothetical protein
LLGRVKIVPSMARPKTPQQKKEDSYAHDRVEGGEYPHADRKNRPRVKALVQRELRRISKQLLASQPEDVLQLAQRPRWTWRKSNVRLPEHLESTQRHRIEREAHNIFRSGYGPATHVRFRRVLLSWMKGRSEYSSSVAQFYVSVLNLADSLHPPVYGPGSLHQRRDFLKQFFAKEPGLKRAFQNWVHNLKENRKIRIEAALN